MWRKTGKESPETRLTQTPFDDIIVGSITLNLTQLSASMGKMFEWYNVMDSYGRINARIQVSGILTITLFFSLIQILFVLR